MESVDGRESFKNLIQIEKQLRVLDGYWRDQDSFHLRFCWHCKRSHSTVRLSIEKSSHNEFASKQVVMKCCVTKQRLKGFWQLLYLSQFSNLRLFVHLIENIIIMPTINWNRWSQKSLKGHSHKEFYFSLLVCFKIYQQVFEKVKTCTSLKFPNAARFDLSAIIEN